jgi:hypothetical protein
MKLCKDCRWSLNRYPGSDGILLTQGYGWLCRHPSSAAPLEPNYVTGREVGEPQYLACPQARRVHSDLCGPEGRFWEATDNASADTLGR